MDTVLAANDILERTLPNHPVIDTLRVLAAVLGIVVCLVAIHRWLDHTRFWCPIAFFCLGVIGIADSVARLGDDFIPWKLPLLLLGNVAALIVLYRVDPIEDGAA